MENLSTARVSLLACRCSRVAARVSLLACRCSRVATRVSLLACLTFLFLLRPLAVSAGPFTPGNIVVVRVGDGAAPLSAAAQATFLLEYTPTGTLVQTVALPTLHSPVVPALTETGNMVSDAQLTRTQDRRYLVLTGYDAAVGTPALARTSGLSVNRMVAYLPQNGTLYNSGRVNDAFYCTGMTNNCTISSAASAAGGSFYAVGNNSGVRLVRNANSGNTVAVTSNSPLTLRVAQVYNNELFVSVASGSSFGIGQIGSGLPTTDVIFVDMLPGFPTTSGPSPYGFFFADLSPTVFGNDVLYVADDRPAPNGGIQKWSLVSGAWRLNGTITGAAAAGLRGLTGEEAGTTVNMFASGDAGLFAITDNAGYNAAPSTTALPAPLATAGANTVFRGVAYAPGTPTFTTPVIAGLSPAAGVAGSPVTLGGQRLTGTTAVTLNGTPVPSFAVNAAGTQITLTVPVGATSGAFTITAPQGTATSTAFRVQQPSTGRIRLDGYRESRYGAAAALQTAATGFGNSTSGTISIANGSELNAAYTRVSGDSLYVLLAGNIESNGNSVELFFDTQSGGQNVLTNTNPNVDNNGLNSMAGLTFDAGFEADYYLGLKATTGSGLAGGLVTAYFASLGATGQGQNPAGGGSGLTDLSLNLGNGRAGTLVYDQSNTGGIDATNVSAGLAGAVVTGLEFVVPLSALGSPSGSLKVAAFVNGGNHGFVSNQTLASLPTGTANLGGPAAVNFNTPAGSQFFNVTLPPPDFTIISFSPTSGPVGTTITVIGTSLFSVTSASVNGTTGTNFSSAVSPTVTFRVAPGTTTGPIRLSGSGGTVISTSNFTVTTPTAPSPAISSFGPATGVAGTAVTLVGTNFTGTTAVTLNGTAAPGFVVNATGTTLTVGVPVGATSGTFAVTTPQGTATSAAFVVQQPSAGRIRLDGYREARYGPATALQTTTTGFGNATNGSPTTALNGSELDAAYTYIQGDSLYVMMPGNVENGLNSLDVFFDTQAGGQNVLTNTNPNVDSNGLNAMAGLTFDSGFAADYYFTVHPQSTGGTVVGASFASLGAGGTGVANAATGSGQVVTLALPNGRAGILALNNANTGGVSDVLASAALAASPVQGVEFVLPLAAIGSPVGSFKVAAFIVNSSHGFLANQTLNPLPTGTPNLGAPGGVNFNTYAGNQYFTVAVPVAAPAPTISGFTPTSGASGTTITITGTNFAGATALTLNGLTITGFVVVNATTITFVVPATATSGPLAVTTTGGTATSAASFTATAPNPVPVIASLSPSTAVAGAGAFTVVVTGTGFLPTSTVLAPAPVGPTTYLSATQLSVVLSPGAVAGSYPFTVVNPSPGGGASNAVNLTVTNSPTITGLAPASVPVNSPAFVLTVDGTNFTASSVVAFNGAALPTTLVSAARLTATVPAAALATIGTYPVVVTTSGTGGTASPAANFNVTMGTASRASQALPGLVLYPNPAHRRLTVLLPTPGPAQVALHDLTGRVVLPLAPLAPDGTLVLPATLAAGCYLLEVRQGTATAMRRITKE